MAPRGPAVSLSLKQRLGQLATSASTPSTPLSPPDGVTSPRKSYFPTWGPKRGRSQSEELDGSQEKLQEVISKLIFQAGVDFETRPMVVISACALPDPREVSYDLLLTRILSYLDLYVESDYTVVFLAAGNKHTPGWNWIWKAYRSLSRKYRKHLKKLYIVHSTWFSKMLISLAGAVVSPKFFRKIQYLNTLSALAQHVPLTQIDIPPAVYQENLKYEKQVTLPVANRSNLFGVPLEDLMGADGEKGGIPRVVKDCVQFLRQTGMNDEGLFRRSPNTVMLNQAKQAYDRGHPVSLESFRDPHLAAVLLKKFLKDLPEPIVPEESYGIIRRCPAASDDPADMAAVDYIRESILPALHSHAAVVLLSFILHLMHDVSLRSAVNKMDAHNLAIVLAPNLVAGSNPARDVAMCFMAGPALFPGQVQIPSSSGSEGKMTLAGVIKICIERYFEIFDDIPDRAEAVGVTASNSMDVPPAEETLSDVSSDASMLVMQVGPSKPASPPPSSWAAAHGAGGKGRYRVMSTPPSAMPTSAFATPSGGIAGTRSLYGGEPNGAGTMSGTIRGKSRSLLSIEKAINANGGRGSITIGKTVGTLRKATGAAVEAVSVTASGFFTPPSAESSPTPAASASAASPNAGSVRAGRPRELSEVFE